MVYGKFVAKQPIEYNGVIAFQPGDPVPEDSVQEHGWENLVEDAPSQDSTEERPAGVPLGAAVPPEEPGAAPAKAQGPANTKKASGSRGSSSGN